MKRALGVLANGCKLPSYVILQQKIMPKEKLLASRPSLSVPEKGLDDQRAHDGLDQGRLEAKTSNPSQQSWDAYFRFLQKDISHNSLRRK
jgi:hypothetical protein